MWATLSSSSPLPLPFSSCPSLSRYSSPGSYEGTGRSLSLKLIEGLRKQCAGGGASGRLLREVKLEEPIRYALSDPVEAWLHELLCLDASVVLRGTGGCPAPQQCNL